MTAASRSAPPAPLPGASRYQLEHRLGEGGSGAVYLAKDLETGEHVAFKKLLRVDAKSVLRLKREFRSLQAVNHPHIIKLYDMGQAADSWFLTMEYLDGSDLSVYLSSDEADTCGPRLISAFRQLAQGMQALHELGMLHRDLKPSNVMVVAERVVVLDFGLVRELDVAAANLTEDGSVAGTPAYMAPEQLLGKELSAASDWYAFGVMLYEAVSGLLPVDGTLLQLLQAKVTSEPVALASIATSAPSWLTELCMALLQRDPSQRPSGKDVLAAFNAADPQALLPRTATETVLATETEAKAESELFGREHELAQLWQAFEQCKAGRSVLAHVTAASGAGKSALVEHFLDQVAQLSTTPMQARPLLLRSRCYELEAMPFKALDGVMDALVRHLSQQDALDVAHVMPGDAAALATVFPVLDRLSVMKRLIATSKQRYDALETRRRAEVALRTLLDNLAARSPVVLWIDDLQWGDLDSARILKNWLAQPSQAPLLLVFSYRSDEAATSSCLRQLLGDEHEQVTTSHEHAIRLEPLTSHQIRTLCEARLRTQVPERAQLIERIVHDAQGSPFLASQLLALADAKAARGETDLNVLSLDLMLAQTSALLTADAQRLLAVLAIAGRPMAPRLALEAARVKSGGRGVVHDLRGLNLVRSREVAGVRMLEVYHDRIRERIQQSLASDERQELHKRLFDAIELSDQAEPDWLHSLALGAGDHAVALRYGKIAAARANAALAFERAAGLYKTCSEVASEPERGELLGELSSACARAGRGVEAAKAALAAAERSTGNQAVLWTQRAASHYLRSGHFAEGERLVLQVLEAEGFNVPRSTAALIAAIAWERIRIKLSDRGTPTATKPPEQALLDRQDLLTALYLATQSHDPLRAALFQARAMRCAFEAGDPTRIMRALCHAAVSAAASGSVRAAQESDAVLARAIALNETLPVPEERTIATTRALTAFFVGRLHDVVEPAAIANRLFLSDAQADPIGNYSRRFAVASVRMVALSFLGDYVPFIAELQALVDDAIATDNRLALLQLTYTRVLAEQLQGQTHMSRARLDSERGNLPPGRFGALHTLHLTAVLSTACWTQDYAWSTARLDDMWLPFLRSTAGYSATLAVAACHMHSRLLLNQHAAERRTADPTPLVQNDLKVLEAKKMEVAAIAANRVRVRLAIFNQRTADAINRLRAIIAIERQRGVMHELARDEYALGALLGGDEGSALCSAAKARMRELGLVDVDGDLRAYYPELMERA